MCTNKNLFDSLSDSIQQNSSMAFLMWNSTSSVFSADFHRCLIIKLWCVSIRVSNGRHKTGLPVNIVGDLAIEHMEIHLMGNITFFMVCSRKIRKWKRSEDDRHEATVSQPHAVFSFNSTWVARINSFLSCDRISPGLSSAAPSSWVQKIPLSSSSSSALSSLTRFVNWYWSNYMNQKNCVVKETDQLNTW